MNDAITRYQEVLDTMMGNRTGIYLSKEELQDLLNYIDAAEALIKIWGPDPVNLPAIAPEFEETRRKLGL